MPSTCTAIATQPDDPHPGVRVTTPNSSEFLHPHPDDWPRHDVNGARTDADDEWTTADADRLLARHGLRRTAPWSPGRSCTVEPTGSTGPTASVARPDTVPLRDVIAAATAAAWLITLVLLVAGFAGGRGWLTATLVVIGTPALGLAASTYTDGERRIAGALLFALALPALTTATVLIVTTPDDPTRTADDPVCAAYQTVRDDAHNRLLNPLDIFGDGDERTVTTWTTARLDELGCST